MEFVGSGYEPQGRITTVAKQWDRDRAQRASRCSVYYRYPGSHVVLRALRRHVAESQWTTTAIVAAHRGPRTKTASLGFPDSANSPIHRSPTPHTRDNGHHRSLPTPRSFPALLAAGTLRTSARNARRIDWGIRNRQPWGHR